MIASAFIILAAVLAASSPDSMNTAHNGPLPVPCIECHTRLPFSGRTSPLREEVCDVCCSCHREYHGNDKMQSHPVSAVPSMRVPPDMVLDKQGRMVCITCHDFHGGYRDEDGKKLFYLRRSPGKTLCFSCHRKLAGASPRR
jgi:predicted CXXCH cytochrome family protein